MFFARFFDSLDNYLPMDVNDTTYNNTRSNNHVSGGNFGDIVVHIYEMGKCKTTKIVCKAG